VAVRAITLSIAAGAGSHLVAVVATNLTESGASVSGLAAVVAVVVAAVAGAAREALAHAVVDLLARM
jgi:hypothetical protein